MSQLLKLIRSAGRSSGRGTAGFGARLQEQTKKRALLVGRLEALDVEQARAALESGADAIEVTLDVAGIDAGRVKALTEALEAPVGAKLSGAVPTDFDARSLGALGLDYVIVEAGAVPASIFLVEDLAVLLEVKEELTDTLLKMLNFLPAKGIEVAAPDAAGFTVRQLMEKRVYRELINKPLLLRVGAGARPDSAELLSLIGANVLIIPAAEAAAWKEALEAIKDRDEEEETSTISLKAPVSAPAAS